MKNRIIFLTLFIGLICQSIIAQVTYPMEYVVFKFEINRSLVPESKQRITQDFYWITPVDSINRIPFNLYPLYIDEYSKDVLDKCIEGDTIDLFTSYNYEQDYTPEHDILIRLINKNKTKLQTITLKWETSTRPYEIITVYATPITGKFCNCFLRHESGREIELYGEIYAPLPLTDFKFNSDFWHTKVANIVKFADYSLIEFNSYILPCSHKRSKCQAISVFKSNH